MEKEDKDTIKHMSETLDKILIILQKPENKLARVFEIAAAGVGILEPKHGVNHPSRSHDG